MRVTLHLGAHRTGTGGLLSALVANSGPLEGAKIAVWGPDEMRTGLEAGLVRKPDRPTVPEEKRGRRAVGRIQLRQAQLEQEGTERLMVVAPDLLGQREDCLDGAAVYPRLSERLDRVAPAFAERCDRVTLSIRRLDRWWSSLMALGLADGRPVPSAAQLDRLVTQPRGWRHVIREVAAALPHAELIVWPAEVLIDLPERQIAAMTGDPDDPLLTPYRSRPDRAPCADTLEEALIARNTPTTLRRGGSGQWLPFDDMQTDAFVAQYQEDLAWLAAGAEDRATAIGLEGTELSLPQPKPVRQQGADRHARPQQIPQGLG